MLVTGLIVTTRQRNCGKVMFSVLPVSVCLGDHYPRCIRSHHKGNLRLWAPLYRAQPGPLVMTSGGQDGRPVQTCSLEDPPGHDIWWQDQRHVQTRSTEDPLEVTFGGSSHGGQAGGAHPTRIPYRVFFRLVAENIYCSRPIKAS